MPDGSMNVHGTAFAGPSTMRGAVTLVCPKTTEEPIVRRPEPLLSVRDGYGCYVIGESMSPAYEPGDLILVHPGRPVRAGDDCVFVRDLDDGTEQALLGRLLRVTDEKWRVQQFNPEKDFDLARGQWEKAQLIVGKYSR